MNHVTLDGVLDIVRAEPLCAETPEVQLQHAVTPAASVYVRSNFSGPRLASAHTITLGGAVTSSRAFGVAELAAMPQRTVVVTMECAGNDRLAMQPLPVGEPWRRGAVSTAVWGGVSLAALLAESGVGPDAVEVLLTGADSGERADAEGVVTFARAIPLADAMHPDTLLALTMNHEPLAVNHGAPVRAVVPGWYGMASVKWVTGIEVLTAPYTGYFQRQRYVYDEDGTISPVTRSRVKSMIVQPADGARVVRDASGRVTLRGWAWSGYAPITHVTLSVQGEAFVHRAELGAPASPHAWTPWECVLVLPHSGRVTLRSCASDVAGHTQPTQIVWNRLGYGNNAVRTTVVQVV